MLAFCPNPDVFEASSYYVKNYQRGFFQGDCPASVTPIITKGLPFIPPPVLVIPPTVLVIPPPYPMCQRHPSLMSNLTLQHHLQKIFNTQLVVDFLQQHLERHSSLTYDGTLMMINMNS